MRTCDRRLLTTAAVLLAPILAGGAGGTSCLPPTPELPGLSATLSASPPYTCARNFYVDPVNGKPFWINAGTSATPWSNLQDANDSGVLKPGDCVNALPGTYNVANIIWLNRGGNANSPTGYVVYRSTVPQGAKLVATTANAFSVLGLQVPYLVIDGFEIDGNNISGEYLVTNTGSAHHLTVINNMIHNSLGGGVGFAGGEYLYVSHNLIYSNAATSLWQESGISIWQPSMAKLTNPTANDNTTFHNMIEYNISHNNMQTFSCAAVGWGAGCHTDGNGIILDYFGAYPYQTLVLGNLVYGNGGKGIHVFHSSNITVANNTSYNNNLDINNGGTYRGELSNQNSTNNTWVNNIAWAKPGSGILSYNSSLFTADSARANTWSKNIGYGGPAISNPTDPIKAPANMIGVNPQLTNPAAGNFTLASNSPALGSGLPESYLSSPAPDIGAY